MSERVGGQDARSYIVLPRKLSGIADVLMCGTLHLFFLATTESQSVSFEELCSSVKEPEEFDHEAKCHLLHDSKTADRAESEMSKDWLCILGHDRLKKRVTSSMCLYIQVRSMFLGGQPCHCPKLLGPGILHFWGSQFAPKWFDLQ